MIHWLRAKHVLHTWTNWFPYRKPFDINDFQEKHCIVCHMIKRRKVNWV